MKKLITFGRYLKDFIRNRQFVFILTSFKYELLGKTTRKDRLYKSDLGLFYSRKGSLDFQFGNYAYEWNVKTHVLKYIDKYDTFLDIGANIGTYSIMLAGKGYNCYAFEPVKTNFNALSINILLNKYNNVIKPYNIGLGSETKEVSFIFDPINTGASHINDHNEEGIETNVKIYPLDEIYNDLEIDKDAKVLCKIDVEGMEVDVVKGAKEFLRSFNNLHLILETDHSGVEPIKEALKEVGDFDFIEIDNLNIAAIKR
jgi:FkbM family methyltransferase